MSKQNISLALSCKFINKYIELESDTNTINKTNLIIYQFFYYIIYLAFYVKIYESISNISFDNDDNNKNSFNNNDNGNNNFNQKLSNIQMTNFLIQIDFKIISFTIYITPKLINNLRINKHMIDFELLSLLNKSIENDIPIFNKIIKNQNSNNTILLQSLGLIDQNKLSNKLSQYKLEIYIPNISILNIKPNIFSYTRGKFRVDEYIIRPNAIICYSDVIVEILYELNSEIDGKVSISNHSDYIENKTIGELKFNKLYSHLNYRYRYIYIIPLIYKNVHKQKEMWTMKIFKY